ncbi:MAG: energy-coupled thiamine transporter ThiT [Lachnospiraceae bacterium]|nr:energy-coupled thiamine transporter ThiT [Lachnospiraceae bacterium]
MSLFLNWNEENYEYVLTTPGYIALALILVAVLVVIALLKKDNRQSLSAGEMSFCAAAIALSTVTSFIKFSSLPYGGSITLFSMLFICLTGYVFGTRIGVMTGVAYGMVQLITGPYIYHPIQVILDYPAAFGALGLAGLFSRSKKGIIPGYLVGVLCRYACHVVSGYVFFASYAPEGTNPVIYTLGYNATYILPEMIATIVVISIPAVTDAISRIRLMFEQETAGMTQHNY